MCWDVPSVRDAGRKVDFMGSEFHWLMKGVLEEKQLGSPIPRLLLRSLARTSYGINGISILLETSPDTLSRVTVLWNLSLRIRLGEARTRMQSAHMQAEHLLPSSLLMPTYLRYPPAVMLL